MSGHRPTLLLGLLALTLTAGCIELPPPGETSWRVTYLGDDVRTHAIEFEDDEVRDRFPDLVDAMQEARGKGINATVHALRSDTLNEYLVDEGFEQDEASREERDPHYIYDKYGNRVNWTASTFRLSGSIG